MRTTINTYPVKSNWNRFEYLDNIPDIGINFQSKNAEELEEANLQSVVAQASEDMKNGLVSFRSVRQFRAETFYKFNPSSNGILPWTLEAVNVSSAFAVISFLFSRKDGVRAIDRIAQTTSFESDTGGRVVVSTMNTFGIKDPKTITSIENNFLQILAEVPGVGKLLSSTFYTQCKQAMESFHSIFGTLSSDKIATTDAIVLYKLARTYEILKKVIESVKDAYGSLKMCSAKVVDLPRYVDHTNWQNVVKTCWEAQSHEEATKVIRSGSSFLDSELIEDVYKVGKFVIETNTLKPDAYFTIFEKECANVLDAIDTFNMRNRKLRRLSEVPSYLNLVYSADLLGIEKMSDADAKLIRVVLLSTDREGDFSSSLVGIEKRTDEEIRDEIEKKRRRLSVALECCYQALSTHYHPAMYESWAGCYGTWTDDQREQLIRYIERDPVHPHETLIHKVVRSDDKITSLSTFTGSCYSTNKKFGLTLNNMTVGHGSEGHESDGVNISGVWNDLVEDAVRLSGVIEIEANKETNEVTVVQKYREAYTIKPPTDGPDEMSFGSAGKRRQVAGREFRIETFDLAPDTDVSIDVMMFFRYCDLNAADVAGAYRNRLNALFKPIVYEHEKLKRTSYFSETDIINPLVKRESGGSHFLQEYMDAIYIPSSFGSIIKDNSIVNNGMFGALVPAGRALELDYGDTFKYDDYYLTDYTLQVLATTADQTVKSGDYRGKTLATLNNKQKTVTLNLFTDNSGQVSFVRGDSYKDISNDKRLIYIQYSDSKLNTFVGDRYVIVESDGEFIKPDCLFLSPIMKANLRDSLPKGEAEIAMKMVLNIMYASHCAIKFKRDKVLGFSVYDQSVVNSLLTFLVDRLERLVGKEVLAANYGLETGAKVGLICDSIKAYVDKPTLSTVAEAMKLIDPVLADLSNPDTIVHPVIPITSFTDSIEKMSRFLEGKEFFDLSAVSGVEIPSLSKWFKPNYASYITRSIASTLDMLVCFCKSGGVRS